MTVRIAINGFGPTGRMTQRDGFPLKLNGNSDFCQSTSVVSQLCVIIGDSVDTKDRLAIVKEISQIQKNRV